MNFGETAESNINSRPYGDGALAIRVSGRPDGARRRAAGFPQRGMERF